MKTFTQKSILNKLQSPQKQLQKGFTLVELLIVVVVLGILSGVAVPNFIKQRDKAKVGAANAASAALMTACEVAITNDSDVTTDADVVRLEAAAPTDAQALVTATLTSPDVCSATVTGTKVGTEGAFTAFGDKTAAIAAE